jgi:Protein of unknown function (DUF1203)
MSTFIITPLPAGEVDVDTPVATHKVAQDDEPCRRCLRNARPGEKLVLAPYNPFERTSPYTGDGPVFVHEHGCDPFPPAPGAVSEQVGGRTLSVRAYDADAMLTDACVLPGEQFAERAEGLLDDAGVDFLHVHFAGPGCFAFRVDRVRDR